MSEIGIIDGSKTNVRFALRASNLCLVLSEGRNEELLTGFASKNIVDAEEGCVSLLGVR